MIFYKILKFHDISMTGKAPITFQGFPGAVGTLTKLYLTNALQLKIRKKIK